MNLQITNAQNASFRSSVAAESRERIAAIDAANVQYAGQQRAYFWRCSEWLKKIYNFFQDFLIKKKHFWNFLRHFWNFFETFLKLF